MSERTETNLCDMTPSFERAWLSSLKELDSESRNLCQFAASLGLEIEGNNLEALSRALVTSIRSRKTAYFIEFFKLLCSHKDTSIDELESSITQLAHIAAASMIAIPSQGDGPEKLKFDPQMHKNKDDDGHGVRALLVLSQGKQAFDLGILLNDSEVLESVAKNIAIDASYYGDADTDAAFDLFCDRIAQALKVAVVKPVKPKNRPLSFLAANELEEYETALATWREKVTEQLDLKNDELPHHALDSKKLPLAFGTIEADDQLIQKIHNLMPDLPLFVFKEQSGRQLVFPKLSTSVFASFLKELLIKIQQQVQNRKEQAKALQSENTNTKPPEAEQQDDDIQPPPSLKQKAEEVSETAKAIGDAAAKTGKAVEQGGDLVSTVVDTAKDVASNLPDLPI